MEVDMAEVAPTVCDVKIENASEKAVMVDELAGKSEKSLTATPARNATVSSQAIFGEDQENRMIINCNSSNCDNKNMITVDNAIVSPSQELFIDESQEESLMINCVNSNFDDRASAVKDMQDMTTVGNATTFLQTLVTDNSQEKRMTINCSTINCTYTASTVEDMQHHKNQMHSEDTLNNTSMGEYMPLVEISSQVQLVNTYRCKICSHQTKVRSNLKSHMKVHDDFAPRFNCSQCNFSTKWKNSLLYHQRIHFRDCPVGEIKCLECNHRLPHDVEKYLCEQCSFETIYKKSMKVHMIRHAKKDLTKLFESLQNQ